MSLRTIELLGAIGLFFTVGCSGPPESSNAPLGSARIRILDADQASRRFVLYVRGATGEWFHGGGKEAFAGDAPRPMEMRPHDRETIAELMSAAGWIDGTMEIGVGTGPRHLEVSLSGGIPNTSFSLLASEGRFDPETEALLAALQSVVEREYRGVLDALPQASPSQP
ncbi:MAG: hypothetical protein GY895_16215 [Phycisphaera sp.]|nr:hypothetical protein [Phycisphaera sp.]